MTLPPVHVNPVTGLQLANRLKRLVMDVPVVADCQISQIDLVNAKTMCSSTIGMENKIE
jgi:hypothetical protein